MVYDRYPLQAVFLTNLFNLFVYALGIIIIHHLGWLYAGLYIAYILILEIRLLKYHCPDCFYYGKVCAFGKGAVSRWFFKKGNPQKFTCREFSYKDLIPDMLVFIIPAITAIVLLILDFTWILLGSLLLLVALNTFGNAYIRGQIACKNCRQKELGCPAVEFFNPEKQP
jgi:hypothetical protein